MGNKFTREEIFQARQLRAQGKTLHEIGQVLGSSLQGVLRYESSLVLRSFPDS